MNKLFTVSLAIALLASTAHAQDMLSNDKPVEISSDMLDVEQEKNQAIFTGNVIVTQGEINMRADKMVVHYRNSPAAAGAAEAPSAAPKGVYRIDADGNVIFTNPTDTARGSAAVYDVDKQTLDLTGEVLLTRDKNVLKGTRMNYNLTTGRSVLTAGGGTVAGQGKGNGRVHGLFIPGSDAK